MNRVVVACFIWMLLLSASLVSRAQNNSAPITKEQEKIQRTILQNVPGWTRNQVTPIAGGRNIAVEQWISGDKVIKITIIYHRSHDEAAKELRKFTSRLKDNRPQNIGDEGYTWGGRGEVAFRKGNLTIFISAVASDLTEEGALNSEFGQQVSNALDQ